MEYVIEYNYVGKASLGHFNMQISSKCWVLYCVSYVTADVFLVLVKRSVSILGRVDIFVNCLLFRPIAGAISFLVGHVSVGLRSPSLAPIQRCWVAVGHRPLQKTMVYETYAANRCP